MLCALAGAGFWVVLLPGETRAVPFVVDVLDNVYAQATVHTSRSLLLRALGLGEGLVAGN